MKCGQPHGIHLHGADILREVYFENGKRADLIYQNKYVYEIRSGAGPGFDERIKQALGQLEQYVGVPSKSGAVYSAGPTGQFSGHITVQVGNYYAYIDYETPEKGVILYTVTQWELIENPEYNYEEIRNTQLNIAPNYMSMPIGNGSGNVAIGGLLLVTMAGMACASRHMISKR